MAHLLAAVYLYATRLNYVSPDLEWLANAYVAEMKMKIEMKRDSTTWTPETRATLEAEMRHAFFDSKAKADTLLGKGVVRPLFDPDKIRSVSHLLSSLIGRPKCVAQEGGEDLLDSSQMSETVLSLWQTRQDSEIRMRRLNYWMCSE